MTNQAETQLTCIFLVICAGFNQGFYLSLGAQQRPEVSKQRQELGIQRPEISTTTAGVLSDKAQKETLSLKERLGSKSEVCSSSSIDSAPKSFKVGNSLKSEKNFKSKFSFNR